MADTQTIKDRIDIVQLISEYVPLKKSGANWKAPCPFHQEKSPSFMVHPEKQIWHCFGCGKGGDIFTFLQEMEGLEFFETLKLLADRAGVKIDTSQRNEVAASERNRLLEINAAAAYFFHHFLLEIPTATSAREYLANRKLTAETIKQWQVGFVPDQWDLLTKYLLKKGFGINDLVLAGLTIKRDGADAQSGRGYYDRFRGRIMFPISDVHGNVIGFTGRVLVETEHSGGKYVNSPQSVLYDKSRVLYGINRAKTEIKAKDLVVVVEGQMDVIACHQAGMTNVVAASGTALTVEQLKLIKRYTENIAMAFDADSAGENAGKRGVSLALESGMRVKVIQIPDGYAKDADECIKKDKAVWFQAVEKAQRVMDWYFQIATRGLNLADPEQKQRAFTTLITEIARVPFAVERDDWLKKISSDLEVDMDVVRGEMKKIKTAPKATTQKVVSQTAPPSAPDTQDTLWQEVWSLILKFPEIYSEIRSLIKPNYLAQSTYKDLYEKAEMVYNEKTALEVENLRGHYQVEGKENRIDLLLIKPRQENGQAEAKSELKQLLARLGDAWRKKRGKELQKAIAAADAAHDRTLVDQLLGELQTLA